MKANGHDKAQVLKSLDSGLRVLECFTRGNPERGVTDLAAELGVSKASVYRALVTLERRRFVLQNPVSGRYRLGPRLSAIGRLSVADLDLPWAARPYMQELRDHVGEEVHLAVLDGGDAVYIAKVDGLKPVQVVSGIGDRSPAHCVSTGKVLLAHSEQETVERLIERGLLCYTERTHATRSSLLGELEKVRERGYAVNWGEWRGEVRGVAAPVMDDDKRVVAAVGICSPAFRLTEEMITRSIPEVMKVATHLSERLGSPVEDGDGYEAALEKPGDSSGKRGI